MGSRGGYSPRDVMAVGRHEVNRKRYENFSSSRLPDHCNSHHIKQHTKPELSRRMNLLLEHRQKKLPAPCKAKDIIDSMQSTAFLRALNTLDMFSKGMVQHTKQPLMVLNPVLSPQQELVVYRLCSQPLLMQNPTAKLAPTVHLDLKLDRHVVWPHEGNYVKRITPWLHGDIPEAWVVMREKLLHFWFAKYLLNIQNAILWNYFDMCLVESKTWGQLLHLCPATKVLLSHALPDMKTPKRVNATKFEGELANENGWEYKEALIQTRDKMTKTFEKAISEGAMLAEAGDGFQDIKFDIAIYQAFEPGMNNGTNYRTR